MLARTKRWSRFHGQTRAEAAPACRTKTGGNVVNRKCHGRAVPTVLAACALASSAALAQKPTPGVTSTEIKIGQSAPFSGPASAYGQISTAEADYFTMI